MGQLWPPNPPETFDHHVQIHQVGDGVGLAIVQSFQGLQKTEGEVTCTALRHFCLQPESVLHADLLLSASLKCFPIPCGSVPSWGCSSQPIQSQPPVIPSASPPFVNPFQAGGEPPSPPSPNPRDSQSHSRPGRRGPSRSGRPDGSAASPGEMHPSSSRESPAGTLPWLPALPCPHLPAGEPRQRLRKEQPALTPSLQTAKALPALQEETAYSQTAQEAAPARLLGEEPAALAAAPLQGTPQSHTGTALGHRDEHQAQHKHCEVTAFPPRLLS